MKQLSMLVLLSLFIYSCGEDHQGKVDKIKFKNEKEKLSYALGVNHALYSLKRFGLSPEDFDQNKLIEGFSKELKKEYVIDSN